MNKLILSLDLVNRILGYLAKQPFEEVAHLIVAVQAEVQPRPQAPVSTEAPKADEPPAE